MKNVADEMTRKLLIDAGIKKGMHVLDIGCRRGDVSLLLADMVGKKGTVIGLDFDESALAYARKQAQDHMLENVTFIQDNLSALNIVQNQFDAIVGRRVLMYLPDPRRVIAEPSAFLKVGGLTSYY